MKGIREVTTHKVNIKVLQTEQLQEAVTSPWAAGTKQRGWNEQTQSLEGGAPVLEPDLRGDALPAGAGVSDSG